jgi:hypothetical protein
VRCRRTAVAALLILATASGCVGEGSRISPPPATTSPSVSPAATRLPVVVLTADLGSRFSGWERVATIPFGEGEKRGELGYHLQRHEGLNVVPPSFAVASDGSFWILDARNARLAHYTANGRYLGWAGHFAWRTIWDARDVVWVDDRLYVLSSNIEDVAASVTSVGEEQGRDPTVPVLLNGDPAVVSMLVPGTEDVVGEVHGYALEAGHEYGTEPPEWGSLAVPGDGAVATLPGVPLQGGTTMAVRAVGFPAKPDRFEVVTQNGDRSSVQPFRLQITDATSAPLGIAGSGVVVSGSTGSGLVCFVKVASSLPLAEGGTAGGRWILEMSSDGSPLVWERLPDPGIADEAQVRHLTVGPDGTVYLMVAGARAESIYRRAPPPL